MRTKSEDLTLIKNILSSIHLYLYVSLIRIIEHKNQLNIKSQKNHRELCLKLSSLTFHWALKSFRWGLNSFTKPQRSITLLLFEVLKAIAHLYKINITLALLPFNKRDRNSKQKVIGKSRVNINIFVGVSSLLKTITFQT